MLNSIGIEGRCVLLLVEYQLANETLLPYLKQLVITGDVITPFEHKLGAPLTPIKELHREQLGVGRRKSDRDFRLSSVAKDLFAYTIYCLRFTCSSCWAWTHTTSPSLMMPLMHHV